MDQELLQAGIEQGYMTKSGHFFQDDEEFEFELQLNQLELLELQRLLLGARTAADLKAAVLLAQRPVFVPF